MCAHFLGIVLGAVFAGLLAACAVAEDVEGTGAGSNATRNPGSLAGIGGGTAGVTRTGGASSTTGTGRGLGGAVGTGGATSGTGGATRDVLTGTGGSGEGGTEGGIGASGGGGGSGAATTTCATANEDESATLTCPAGSTISSIEFASYGTPSGSCGAFATSSCDAADSTSVVSAACLGQSTCTVDASNSSFGDPCYGTEKHLAVEATCTPAERTGDRGGT